VRCSHHGGRPRSHRARLVREGVLEKFNVEMIGASQRAIDMAEDRELFAAPCPTSVWRRRGHASPIAWKRRLPSKPRSVSPRSSGPPSPWRQRRGIAYNREEFEEIVARGLDASPTNEVLLENRDRLERIRDGGGPRPQRQLHHRVLIENVDPMGFIPAIPSPWRPPRR